MGLSEIRKKARENLNEKWETAVVFMLIYAAIDFAISIVYTILSFFPFMSTAAYIGLIFISIPISYGIHATFMDIKRGKTINYLDYLKIAYSNFKKAWCITGNILKKVWVYLLVYICLILTIFVSAFGLSIFSIAFESEIFAIMGCLIMLVCVAALIAVAILLTIKSYYYVLAYFIAIDNPDMTAKDVVSKSEDLMTGHRAEYFVLNLSFIGWAILSVLTLGIGFLWLIPYMFISFIIFYEKLIGKNDVEISETVPTIEESQSKIDNSVVTLSEKVEEPDTTTIVENSDESTITSEVSEDINNSIKSDDTVSSNSDSEDITSEDITSEDMSSENTEDNNNNNNDDISK